MLSLQLKSGEYLTIGDQIAVQIFEQGNSTFRVAVKAPREIPILRGEVRERTEARPDGLRAKRPKSPTERQRDARRLEQWAEREERRRREDAEKADVMRELMRLADRVDALLAGQGQTGVRDELKDVRARLTELTSRQAAG